LASSDSFRIGGKYRGIPIPPGGQLPPPHQFDIVRQLGKFFALSAEEGGPFFMGLASTSAASPGQRRGKRIRPPRLRGFPPPGNRNLVSPGQPYPRFTSRHSSSPSGSP